MTSIVECPEHNGSFDCTPFCRTCSGEQEYDEHEDFVCIDCAACTLCAGEYYMVTDQVWERSGLRGDDGMLCIGCLEQRLGRLLHAKDFTDAPINQMSDMTDDASARLLNRLRNYQVRISP